ncbi:hypothetical protein TOPH_02403 [Tolypocladium ophioglossoides CBS 100239]|uniref:Uncharacterized protein n=1 Tax=Tolypocladium ophioglossoides (strain CBS 100239) TaxID=1163406 RepID=A0A0L0NFS0_TOLOC|nr:hypothetical protein TOPH_02403 [Tolypocladium ophioglossoides CBS 100239]
MTCFCHKLLSKQYSDITKSEAEILTQTWKEAPHLFRVPPLSPPDVENPTVQRRTKRSTTGTASRVRKHPRTLPALSSNNLIPDRSRDQPSQACNSEPPLSSTIINLVNTYSYQNAVRVFGIGDGLDIQHGTGSSGVFVRVFLAIERGDQKIEIQQVFRRICCYAFAQLHRKGISVDPIVQEIENALPLVQDTRQKVYHILRIGTKWVAIVEKFGSIVNRTPPQLTGLLCLLGSGSTWERASTQDYLAALTRLSKNTDICEKTSEFTPLVGNVLNQISLESSFVDETRRLTSQSESSLGAMPVSRFSRSSLKPGLASTCRAFHTVSEVEPAWKAPSLAAVSEAVPGSSSIRSEDANILLVLLSFLSPSEEIPLDLLFRGAMPRRRWTV